MLATRVVVVVKDFFAFFYGEQMMRESLSFLQSAYDSDKGHLIRTTLQFEKANVRERVSSLHIKSPNALYFLIGITICSLFSCWMVMFLAWFDSERKFADALANLLAHKDHESSLF